MMMSIKGNSVAGKGARECEVEMQGSLVSQEVAPLAVTRNAGGKHRN
jgi:hypothetical protein